MDDMLKALIQKETETRFCHEDEPLGRGLEGRIQQFKNDDSTKGMLSSPHGRARVIEMRLEHEAERAVRYVRIYLKVAEEAGANFDEHQAEWLKTRIISMVDHRGEGIRSHLRDDVTRRGDKGSRLHEYLNSVIDQGLGNAKANACREVAVALGRAELSARRAEGEAVAEARKRADSLTGFLTRNDYEAVAPTVVRDCTEQKRPLSLVRIDLDGFKGVNDSLGHDQGDQVLREAGELIRGVIGTRGTIGRYGGDEFDILLPDFVSDEALAVAERLRTGLAGHEIQRVDGTRPGLFVKMTVGISSLPEHATDLETLMKRADEALYEAKDAGRNCVRVARPGGRPPDRT